MMSMGDSLPDIPPTVISFGTDTNIYLFVLPLFKNVLFYTCIPIVFLLDGQLFLFCV